MQRRPYDDITRNHRDVGIIASLKKTALAMIEDSDLLTTLRLKSPQLWINPSYGSALPDDALTIEAIADAETRMQRHASALARLFPELASSGGIVESPLDRVDPLQTSGRGSFAGDAWFIKRDDLLPVAGSIKARGGFHEVLSVAERLWSRHCEMHGSASREDMFSDRARQYFAQHTISVGSTGNLGLSIGVIAAALGFDAVVHMSNHAKAWKKQRLVDRGVRVREHAGDYASAVDAGRQEARRNPHAHFVDDERSPLLFLGYAASARWLAHQLDTAGRRVDRQHPLFVYVPCGVGGAPGGIAYGLKKVFGEHVHCFFAEPVASPCMLVQLASNTDAALSVYDVGLDNHTDADGLAVGQASLFASRLMKPLLSGVFTVSDDALYEDLLTLYTRLGIELEPSALAALRGPHWLEQSEAGSRYLAEHAGAYSNATHVIWATGGSLVPAVEHERFRQHALEVAQSRGTIL